MHFNLLFSLMLLLARTVANSSGTVAGTNLTLLWSFPDSQYIDLTIEWKQPTYFTLMLGDTMVKSDLWVCSLENGTEKWTVTDRW